MCRYVVDVMFVCAFCAGTSADHRATGKEKRQTDRNPTWNKEERKKIRSSSNWRIRRKREEKKNRRRSIRWTVSWRQKKTKWEKKICVWHLSGVSVLQFCLAFWSFGMFYEFWEKNFYCDTIIRSRRSASPRSSAAYADKQGLARREQKKSVNKHDYGRVVLLSVIHMYMYIIIIIQYSIW